MHRLRRYIAFVTAALVALLVHALVPAWLHGATRFVAAYDAGALTLLANFWWFGMCKDAEHTRMRAERRDPGRNAILLLVLVAVAVGLLAAIAIVGHGPKVANAFEKWEAYTLGIIAIAVGWGLVHTVFAFRYAHLFWYDANHDGQAGGIIFPQTPAPADIDFAYFAFCIGTSFAVSDPQVTSRDVRREVIGHSIISFAYNSVIIGMLINLFAGIFSSPGSSGS